MSHGYGIMTRYGHLSGYNVKVGQRVKARRCPGSCRQHRSQHGAALHYEVLVHQRNVDPVKYILEEFRSF